MGTSLNQGSSVPSKAPTPLPATFDQKDYPDIRFWKKTDWTEFCSKKKDLTTGKTATKLNESLKPRGKTRISESDENVNNQYLEKEDGSTIGGTEAGELHALIRSVFDEQKKVDGDNMPSNWGSATMSFRNFVFQQVYLKFPFLQLCRSDWKVSQIAGTTYSSWKTHKKQKKATKDESTDPKIEVAEDLTLTSSDECAVPAIPPAKRPFSPEATMSRSSKRPCTDTSSASER